MRCRLLILASLCVIVLACVSGSGSSLGDLSSRNLDDLMELRNGLEIDVGKGMGEETDRHARADLRLVDREILGRLRAQAKALESAGPEKIPAALAAYSRVEDEATMMLDKCMRGRDEEAKVYLTTQFKEIVAESNEFVTRVFTPEYRERTPWTDLLTSDRWLNSGLQTFRLDAARLEVVGPAAGSTANGLIACPVVGGYRDFEMEMYLTLEGTVDLLFRLGRRVDTTVESFPLSTEGEQPLSPSLVYTVHVTYIGDRLRVDVMPEDYMSIEVQSDGTKSRKGAIGAQVREGARFTITRLRVRVLRGA